jgi:S-adenosylmethionine hydrolase
MSGRRPRSGTNEISDRERARTWRSSNWKANGVVSILTDFGTRDPYVGIMRGVILDLAPDARLVDLTQHVPPQSVAVGALLLRSAVEYFPPGTVHLAVVDPGVGSDRAPIAVVTRRGALVGPDNGLLHASAEALGVVEIRRIANENLFRRPVSHTFHGRDIFAPAAGHLAAGGSLDQIGPVLESMVPLDGPVVSRDTETVEGTIVHVDHFGNLISNIRVSEIGEMAAIEIAEQRLDRLSSSYADAPRGGLLAIEGSWGTLEIACNGGSAADALSCNVDTPVIVRLR